MYILTGMFPEAITIHYTELLLQQQIWIDFYAHITIRWSQFLSCVLFDYIAPKFKTPLLLLFVLSSTNEIRHCSGGPL